MDNSFIIDNLLNQNRSESLEFKTDLSYEGIAKLVTFMLNRRGGDILIGVDEQKRVVGLDSISIMDAGDLLKKLTLDIQPSAPIDVQNVVYAGYGKVPKNLIPTKVKSAAMRMVAHSPQCPKYCRIGKRPTPTGKGIPF